MIRTLVIAGVMLASAVAGGCTFRPMAAEGDASPIGSLDRAERARSQAGRMHPACRDDRADRSDQQDGCRDVVRRGE